MTMGNTLSQKCHAGASLQLCACCVTGRDGKQWERSWRSPDLGDLYLEFLQKTENFTAQDPYVDSLTMNHWM